MMKDCNNCKHEACWEYAEPCGSCTTITGEPTNWQPQTNYNRIKSKTPEELAEWVAGYVLNLTGAPLKMSTEAWAEWLKREAE